MESLRYRQRVEHLERELQELQDSLNAEREKVQVWLGVSACDFNEYRAFLGLPVPKNEFLKEFGGFQTGIAYNQMECLVLSLVRECGNSKIS